MGKCRETAFKIARGSGRKQVPADLTNWINKEFATVKEKENGREKVHVYVLHNTHHTEQKD
jgi:hypothetical protein